MLTPPFIPLPPREFFPDDALGERTRNFRAEMEKRRTVRHFSSRPVPRNVIEDCLAVAGSAPSGANLQPWHFVAVADPALKHEIRAAAEAEEREFTNTARRRNGSKRWPRLALIPTSRSWNSRPG